MKRKSIFAAAITTLLLISCNTDNIPQDSNITKDAVTQQALETWKNDHFGMFIHFGIYSKLAGIWKDEMVPFYGEQIMNHARITVPEYEDVEYCPDPVKLSSSLYSESAN